MNLPRIAGRALRSLLVMLAATFTLVAVSWASGELAAWLHWPRGGHARLGWDLGGVVLAGVLAFAVLARWAPAAPREHVIAGLGLLAAAAAWAVITLGADFPSWFSASLLLSLPLQAWAGWRFGHRPR